MVNQVVSMNCMTWNTMTVMERRKVGQRFLVTITLVAYHIASLATGEKMSGAGMGNGLAGLTYYASNEDDPYITLKNVVRAHNLRSLLTKIGMPIILPFFSPSISALGG